MITRAVILIGVSQASTLPKLQAVYDGVRRMKEWAVSQGIPDELIGTITDETEKVTPERIKKVVWEFVDRGDIEQLIIYFAGHGVNLRYDEYWLLSDAVTDSDAAVNLSASVARAENGGVIPHVVFLSDACRTAPGGIEAQGVTGSVIFPNKLNPGQAKVDQFFATQIGEPALEIAGPNTSPKTFRAVYTDLLLEALRGLHADILEADGQTGMGLVRPEALEEFLEDALPKLVYDATKGAKVRTQVPFARINSRKTWLSRVPALTTPPKFGPPMAHPLPVPVGGLPNLAALARGDADRASEVMRTLLADDHHDLVNVPQSLPVAGTEATIPGRSGITSDDQQFLESIRTKAEPFGPLHFESGCGFKVRGAKVAACFGNGFAFDLLDDGASARIFLQDVNCASVLLTFDNGQGVLLPAIRDYLATLTVDDGLLVEVSYEPSDTSPRWEKYQKEARHIRTLRAIVAAASRQGTFRLQGEDGAKLAKRMQFAKSIDPSLALYAAHAFRDQGNRKRIKEMAFFMQQDLGVCLYDIALLAGMIHELPMPDGTWAIYPFLPMLAQRWALLPAYDVQLPPLLKGIQRHVSPSSLWTLYDPPGVTMISQVLHEGEVR